MKILHKTYWLIYVAISSALLLSMLALGLKDRTALEPLLENGGFVESLPALVFLIAAALSAFLAVRARRFLLWGLYSGFCFFLAGEEAEWGRDRVLGWELWWYSEDKQPGDIHNLFGHLLENLFSYLLAQGVSSWIAYVIASAVIVLSFGFLASALAFGFLASAKVAPGGWLRRLKLGDLSQQFVITGVGLMLFGFVDILQESFGLPYIQGLWPLEESFELLGSIALLFAVLVKVLEPSHTN